MEIFANRLQNFGSKENFANTWDVYYDLGGQGSWELSSEIRRGAEFSIKLSKTNSLGYVRLSARQPVRVEAGKLYTLRFWFYAANAQITSFLIPRLVSGDETTAVSNPDSALWVNYDYDSQSLMRNAPSSAPADWVKRVVFYENKTEHPQDIFIQIVLYGNPFDVYLDDLEFEAGKRLGHNTPATTGYAYSEEQVLEILSQRAEETATLSGEDGSSHFFLNAKKAWPIFYRGLLHNDLENGPSIDPAGFAAQGISIQNVIIELFQYWKGSGEYDWKVIADALMNTLRKNLQARLLLDLHIDVSTQWGKDHPDEIWEIKDGTKIRLPSYSAQKISPASYSSLQWRKDGAEAIRNLILDLKTHGFWKIVVGVNIVGGHDWQFWTKVIGEFAADYSPANRRAWQKWLENQYANIERLNAVWSAGYADFSEIQIPDPTYSHETYPVIMTAGLVPDFRQFCEAAAFDLRECFGQALKAEAGKDIFVSAYGMPMENQHACFLEMAGKTGKANDFIASMSYYPYRQPGFASGYHPEQSFGYHNTGFIQELDLRSFASDMAWYDELSLMWCSSQPDINQWRAMHRKLVGISLAQNQSFWYYDMDKQFVDPAVLAEIGAVKRIADELIDRSGVEFRPDVCLVRFGDESRYYGSSVDSAVGATVQWQYMLLETSGVPYDIHYLADIIAEPSLQRYKIYIFHNHTFLSKTERAWIDKNLKKDQRALVWLYDSGYGTEGNLSGEALSDLVEMSVCAEEGYTRSVAVITGNDRLVGGTKGTVGVPPFQGMAEALCAIFTTQGPSSLRAGHQAHFGYRVVPGVSRYQRFWVKGGYDSVLARYIEDGKPAMTVKRFVDWTSIYIAAPNALAGEMLNNIAQETGAYCCGPAGMGELRMSGRFVSYHALVSGEYPFTLPVGATKVLNPETGDVLVEGSRSYTIVARAQETHWLFIE